MYVCMSERARENLCFALLCFGVWRLGFENLGNKFCKVGLVGCGVFIVLYLFWGVGGWVKVKMLTRVKNVCTWGWFFTLLV
jgi:hypothetical protein